MLNRHTKLRLWYLYFFLFKVKFSYRTAWRTDNSAQPSWALSGKTPTVVTHFPVVKNHQDEGFDSQLGYLEYKLGPDSSYIVRWVQVLMISNEINNRSIKEMCTLTFVLECIKPSILKKFINHIHFFCPIQFYRWWLDI